jgi:hypothetical protein
MNLPSLNSSVSPYRAHLRPAAVSILERNHIGETAAKIADLSHLSLESKVSLSHKAQTLPAAAVSETRRRPSTPPQVRKGCVSTTDFAGRQCSGSLHGPLLMEDAPLATLQPKPSNSLDMVFEHQSDRDSLRSASLMLGMLGGETLHAPSTGESLSTLPAGNSTYSYLGVEDGVAKLVQTFHQPVETRPDSRVRLGDGSEVQMRWESGEFSTLSIYLPAESLDTLVNWGRSSWMA